MLLKEAQKNGSFDFSRPVLLGYGGLDDTLLKKFYEDSKEVWDAGQYVYDPVILSGAIGTHLGPGVIGVAFFAKN